jgi:hypothetical protein
MKSLSRNVACAQHGRNEVVPFLERVTYHFAINVFAVDGTEEASSRDFKHHDC